MVAMGPLMENVRFSIIIPTTNEEENIVKCLKSISDKKDCMMDTVFETIIVDGASRDRTIQTAEAFILQKA
jgi:glycosyltransferase involved in cell wall biosynthesis